LQVIKKECFPSSEGLVYVALKKRRKKKKKGGGGFTETPSEEGKRKWLPVPFRIARSRKSGGTAGEKGKRKGKSPTCPRCSRWGKKKKGDGKTFIVPKQWFQEKFGCREKEKKRKDASLFEYSRKAYVDDEEKKTKSATPINHLGGEGDPLFLSLLNYQKNLGK